MDELLVANRWSPLWVFEVFCHPILATIPSWSSVSECQEPDSLVTVNNSFPCVSCTSLLFASSMQFSGLHHLLRLQQAYLFQTQLKFLSLEKAL